MMLPFQNDIIMALRLILPAYVANATPVIVGGGPALDLGRKFIDGRSLFGSNKTIRGLVGGLCAGTIVAFMEEFFDAKGLLAFGVLATVGTMLGDLAGAFLKRRLGIAPGSPLPLVDQLDFIAGAILMIYPFYNPSAVTIILTLLATPPIHIATNMAAYWLGLRTTFR